MTCFQISHTLVTEPAYTCRPCNKNYYGPEEKAQALWKEHIWKEHIRSYFSKCSRLPESEIRTHLSMVQENSSARFQNFSGDNFTKKISTLVAFFGEFDLSDHES